MEKILNEILSTHITGKNKLKMFGNNFETENYDDLKYIFNLLDKLEIKPNGMDLEVNGKIIELNLNEEEKNRLEIICAKRNLENLLLEQKIKENFDKIKEKVYRKNYDDLDNKIYNIGEESDEIIEPKDKFFKRITKEMKKVFTDTLKVYDTGENFVFLNKSDKLEFNHEDLIKLSNVLFLLKEKEYKIKLAISPLYDYNDDENENIIGIIFILNIIY